MQYNKVKTVGEEEGKEILYMTLRGHIFTNFLIIKHPKISCIICRP